MCEKVISRKCVERLSFIGESNIRVPNSSLSMVSGKSRSLVGQGSAT